jgi:NAD(P)-dependent dehydrogenase (short-subunit alcohol dehydrogenase family)
MTARTIAITGGARGIGRATAHELLRRGHRVVVGDLDPAAAGPGLEAHRLDVTDEASFAAFLDAAAPVDVLVNNAGIAVVVPFAQQTAEQQRREVAVNLGGVLTGTRLALARGVGQVVNVASSAGRFATPGIATYSATKHAVVGLTEAVRSEPPGVAFSVVLPGPVETEMIAGTRRSRFVRVVQPEDVAGRGGRRDRQGPGRPRRGVVPRELGTLQRLMAPLPPRVRRRLAALLQADRIYTEVDGAQRAGYEARLQGGRPV